MAYDFDHNNPSARPVLVPNYASLNSVNPNFVHNHHPQASHHAIMAQIQLERSRSLIQFMNDEGLVPSQEEEQRRNNVIHELKRIVFAWVKKVGNLQRMPQYQIKAASATILTFGSYGLGVYNAESDIDALCVGPRFASLTEDFFVVLRNMLEKRIEVSDIHCIKDARVPLMRFKFEGISIDMPYAQLQVKTVPENIDIFDPFYLNGIDETSWKSLSGVRANISILRLVPDVKKFQELLRCVKLWAKRRGVYGTLFGFLGGVHLAVLTAFICQRCPNVNLAGLILIFFKTYAFWAWRTPVLLQPEIMVPRHPHERRPLMAVQLPSSPNEYCHCNVTPCTLMKITREFHTGFLHIKDMWKSHFDWRDVFEPYAYSKNYLQFLKINISTCEQDEFGDWLGWVKSRIPCLLHKLEELNVVYDPDPSEYTDTSVQDPNVVFYWGLKFDRCNYFDLNWVQREFKKILSKGYKHQTGNISLSVIPTSELFENLQDVDTQQLYLNSSQLEPVD